MIWSILKNRLNKRYNWRLPIIKKDKDVEAFKRIISEEWENIPQEIIDNCILSMPQRYMDLKEAKGSYTKY